MFNYWYNRQYSDRKDCMFCDCGRLLQAQEELERGCCGECYSEHLTAVCPGHPDKDCLVVGKKRSSGFHLEGI